MYYGSFIGLCGVRLISSITLHGAPAPKPKPSCKINQAWLYGLEALRPVACLHVCWPAAAIAACLHKINVMQTIRGLLNTRIVRLLTASVIMFSRDKFFCYHVNLLHTLTLKVLKNNFHSLSSAEASLDKDRVHA